MKKTTLRSLYSFSGFQALASLKDAPGDPDGRIITLRRRQKKRPVPAVIAKPVSTTGRFIRSVTWTRAASEFISNSSIAGCCVKGAKP
jgi:hypothetical protein